jgi:hypothetical protein
VLEVDHVVSGFADKSTVNDVTPAQVMQGWASIGEIKQRQIIPQNKKHLYTLKSRFISINPY